MLKIKQFKNLHFVKSVQYFQTVVKIFHSSGKHRTKVAEFE